MSRIGAVVAAAVVAGLLGGTAACGSRPSPGTTVESATGSQPGAEVADLQLNYLTESQADLIREPDQDNPHERRLKHVDIGAGALLNPGYGEVTVSIGGAGFWVKGIGAELSDDTVLTLARAVASRLP